MSLISIETEEEQNKLADLLIAIKGDSTTTRLPTDLCVHFIKRCAMLALQKSTSTISGHPDRTEELRATEGARGRGRQPESR